MAGGVVVLFRLLLRWADCSLSKVEYHPLWWCLAFALTILHGRCCKREKHLPHSFS
jgi:hypothetical protein